MNVLILILLLFSNYTYGLEKANIKTGNLEWMGKNLSIKVEGAVCLENCDLDGYYYSIQEARIAAKKKGNGWRVPTNADWLIFEEYLTKNTPGKAYTKGALSILEGTNFIESFSGLLSANQIIIDNKKAIYFLTDSPEQNPDFLLTRKFTKGDDLIYKSLISNEYKLKVRLVKDI